MWFKHEEIALISGYKPKWPEITKDTPLEEVRRIHKRIWQYVVDHGKKPETPYLHGCVLCEYDLAFGNGGCLKCPVIPYSLEKTNEPITSPMLHCLNGLYYLWRNASLRSKKTEFAVKIRDIPFKNLPS